VSGRAGKSVSSMDKIRINVLARELEVKAHELLEKLPELGVTEKKTHSSSIDEDVAEKLRRIFGGGPGAGESSAPAGSNGSQAVALEEPGAERLPGLGSSGIVRAGLGRLALQ